jgi:hypothetical protein
MDILRVTTRINTVYAVGVAYTLVTTAIAWFASITANKLITDSCRDWIKPTNSTMTGSTNQFFEDASKQEICRWAPFVADAVIVAGTFQIMGMGLYGAKFRVTDITKVKYGTGGLSGYLMESVNEQNSPVGPGGSPFGLSADVDLRDVVLGDGVFVTSEQPNRAAAAPPVAGVYAREMRASMNGEGIGSFIIDMPAEESDSPLVVPRGVMQRTASFFNVNEDASMSGEGIARNYREEESGRPLVVVRHVMQRTASFLNVNQDASMNGEELLSPSLHALAGSPPSLADTAPPSPPSVNLDGSLNTVPESVWGVLSPEAAFSGIIPGVSDE